MFHAVDESAHGVRLTIVVALSLQIPRRSFYAFSLNANQLTVARIAFAAASLCLYLFPEQDEQDDSHCNNKEGV
jgi:hypothetical protein